MNLDRRTQRFEDFWSRKKPHLAGSAVFRWAAMINGILIAFLLTPFIIKTLGNAGYGIWTIVTSILGYYGLLNLGVTSAVSRYAAVYIGNRNLESLNRVFSTSICFFLFTGSLVILLSWFGAPYFAALFSDTPDERFVFLVRAVGIAAAINFQTAVFISILIAHEKYAVQSVFSISISILKAVALYFVLLNGHDLWGMAIVYTAVAALELFAYIVLLKVELPWISFGRGSVRYRVFRELISFGVPSFLLAVSWQIMAGSDRLVISGLIGLEEVAFFSVAALVVRYASRTVITGLGVFSSRFARMVGEGQQFKELFQTSLFYSATISAILAGGVFLFGGRFISLWVGSEYLAALPVLWILMTGNAISVAQQPNLSLLMALNKHRLLSYITMGEMIVNVALSIYLAPIFGIVGVAIGTAVPRVFVKVILEPLLVIRVSGVAIVQYISALLIPIGLVAVFVLVPLSLGIHVRILSFNWVELVAYGAGYACAMFAAGMGVAYVVNPRMLKLVTDSGGTVVQPYQPLD